MVGGGGDALTTSPAGILASAAPEDGLDADTKPDDSFRAYTYNTTPSASTAAVWAICAPGNTRYQRADVGVRVNKAKNLKAKCPNGTSVVGGGIYLTGSNSEIFISATRPWDSGDKGKKPDDGWFVRAANVAGSHKVMTAPAMCRSDLSHDPFGGFGACRPASGVSAADAIRLRTRSPLRVARSKASIQPWSDSARCEPTTTRSRPDRSGRRRGRGRGEPYGKLGTGRSLRHVRALVDLLQIGVENP